MIKINKKLKAIFKIFIIISILLGTNYKICFADDVDEELDEPISINEIEDASKELSNEPVTNSRRMIIYDRNSKRIMYGKNENVKAAMASTTKIMTATIVIENADLNKEVIVGKKAALTGGSRLGLKENDKITIRDLLYGLMMKSGNDAAVQLAIEVGGSVEGFADIMNKKAEDLGLTKTHFVTPHGLDDPEHYTTAYELAKLTDYALKNKTFKEIVGTKQYTITINGYPKELNNTNELLGVLNGVIGVKTGFTNNAGRCLVTETKRGDRDLITVVLGADTKKIRTKDSVKLIEYGFSSFKDLNIEENAKEEFENWNEINSGRMEIEKGKNKKIDLYLGEILNKEIPIKESDIDKVEYNINSVLKLEAPVEKNLKIGTMEIKLNDETIENVDIYTKKKIERKDWRDYFKENIALTQNLL